MFERPAAVGTNEGVPRCSEMVLRERRSCLVEDESAFIHIWGVVRETYSTRTVEKLIMNLLPDQDGGNGSASLYSLHSSTVAAEAAAKGKRLRVALNIKFVPPWVCPECPTSVVSISLEMLISSTIVHSYTSSSYRHCFQIVPMDVHTNELANEFYATLAPLLQPKAKTDLNIDVSKKAIATMMQETQLYHYKVAVRQLMIHLDESGINCKGIEGSTSLFLNKLRLMQGLAHDAWGFENGTKTVCEVGRHAHSFELHLMSKLCS